MEDREIIELYFRRDERAIRETDRKYGRLCFSPSRNILASGEDARECVSDAYLALWRRIPPERPENLMAYLVKIVRNLSLKRLDHDRAKKRCPELRLSFEELEATCRTSVLRRKWTARPLPHCSARSCGRRRPPPAACSCAGTGFSTASGTSRRASVSARARSNPCCSAHAAACACLLIAVLALAAGLVWQGQRGVSAPFVLTAYAAQEEGGPLAGQLRPGQAVPVSAFTVENGLKGAVFSHAADDPKAPASVLILADGLGAEGTIRAIAGLELEMGTVYLFCVLPEDGQAQHSFPYLLRNEAQNTVTALSISIERDEDGYSAKIENAETKERKAAP